jgi:hypothetical protein
MIRRRPRLVVQAFSRLFGRGREAAEVESTKATAKPAAAPLALVALPGGHSEVLRWTQPRALRSEWRLDGADGPMATLRAGNRSYAARTAAGPWTLAVGWTGRILVNREGAREHELSFEPRAFAADRVVRAAGEALCWRLAGLSHWRLGTEDGRELIEVRSRGFMHGSMEVTLAEAARTLPDLDALVLLTGALPVVATRSSSHGH